MSTLFASSRLIYRSIEESDDPFLSQLQQDDEAQLNSTPFLAVPQNSSNASGLRKLLTARMLAVIICLKQNDDDSATKPPTPIGFISLSDANFPNGRHFRNAKLGVTIIRHAQGKGYATEAMQWCLDWGFRHAALHKVSTYVYDYNKASIKLCEKTGFKLDGRLRDEVWYDGRFWDDLAFSMLENEWKAKYGNA